MSTSAIFVFLFWFGLFGTVYAYVVFPVLVGLLARRRDTAPTPHDSDATVRVTVIVPAYNEERSLPAKIRNVLDAGYPRELLDVLVVSDASTDRTDDIARGFQKDGVRLIVQEKRSGKSSGLNRAVALARGEVVIFTDANAIYPAGTISAMLRYFDNPRVGLVTGYTRYRVDEGGGVGDVTNAYTKIERVIKKAESRWGCCVGADGAIFALRRSLYRTLRSDDINDLVIPLSVIEQRYECVFAEDAVCTEWPGANLESEFRRQSRITNRTLRALWRHAHLLNPLRFPLFAFFLLSHKVVRFLVPAFLALSTVALVALATRSPAFLVLTGAALALAMTAMLPRLFPALGAGESRSARLLHLLYAFLTINLAVIDGWWRFVTGRSDVTWQHDRSVA